MPDTAQFPWSHILTVAELPAAGGAEFSLVPDAPLRQQIATELGVAGLRKLRFDGTLVPIGAADWQLRGRLGATAMQSCVITLQPVTSRIDDTIERRFVKTLPQYDTGSELEVPEDDTLEALGATIDAGQVMVEALALALPQFPRAPDAELAQSNFTEPGKSPMADADARPFAQLKSQMKPRLKPKGDTATKKPG